MTPLVTKSGYDSNLGIDQNVNFDLELCSVIIAVNIF